MDNKNNLFQEIKAQLLHNTKPSEFMNKISKDAIFKEYPFNMLLKLKSTGQSPKHHPEGSVWKHTMLVIDEAAKRKKMVKNPSAFMLAALLHDIGKPDTTKIKKGRITSYNHDKVGANLAYQFLMEFESDESFVKMVVALVRWHMQILFVVKDMVFADINAMKSEVDVNELAILGLCDRLGRKGVDHDNEHNTIELFLKKCLEG